MTLTQAQTTKPATDALTDLVWTARERARKHEAAGNTSSADVHVNIARTLDRARTRLVEDGIEYLDAAWAFVDGARQILARMPAA